jgi:hypothetical protein
VQDWPATRRTGWRPPWRGSGARSWPATREIYRSARDAEKPAPELNPTCNSRLGPADRRKEGASNKKRLAELVPTTKGQTTTCWQHEVSRQHAQHRTDNAQRGSTVAAVCSAYRRRVIVRIAPSRDRHPYYCASGRADCSTRPGCARLPKNGGATDGMGNVARAVTRD